MDPNLLNNANGPLYTAYRWDFNLNTNTGVLAAGGPNTDITQVYIDSDGDGVPDAWDDQPDMFDADGNGVPDGLQDNVDCDLHDNGNHHSSCHDHNEDLTANNQIPDSDYVFPVTGVVPLIATPFLNTGLPNTNTTALVPDSYPSDFKVFHGRLYIVCDGNGDGSVTDLCRQFSVISTLNDKARFINGTPDAGLTTIILNRSTDLNYLETTNNFRAANRIMRNPPIVW